MSDTENKSKTSNTFDEYVSSFFNAFELPKDGDSLLSSTSLQGGLDNEKYINDYVDYAYTCSKPPMQKSLSWSSTNPSIAFERDSYLMPYACSDYKKLTSSTRPRSITLSPKSSPKYLRVDNNRSTAFKSLASSRVYHQSSPSSYSSTATPHSPQASTTNLRSIKEAPFCRHLTVESDEYAYNSSQDEIDMIHCDVYDGADDDDMDGYDLDAFLRQQPRRERANTAPPNISITAEDGHSKYILNVLSEEAAAVDANHNALADTKVVSKDKEPFLYFCG